MNVYKLIKPATMNSGCDGQFVVVHPLDDVAEEKVNISGLGAMPMTTTVRLSLIALRGYLALMMALVFYHVVNLAGIFGRGR